MYVYMKFPFSPRKWYVPHVLANLKLHTYRHFFIKKIMRKEWIIFTKLKKQNFVSVYEISWFTKKSVCTTYIILWYFGSPAKWRQCTYDSKYMLKDFTRNVVPIFIVPQRCCHLPTWLHWYYIRLYYTEMVI